MKRLVSLTTLLLCMLSLTSWPVLAEEEQNEQEYEMSEEEAAYWEWAYETWNSLTPRTGGIALGNGLASLDVPQQFHYFSPQDARVILEELWDNQPDEMDSLGLLMPAGIAPMEPESWAVTIDYEKSGYVSDADADELDYEQMMKTMQKNTAAWNDERIAQGYAPITLLGWASEPFYDKSAHKVYWAKELKFGDSEVNTLNYDVRILGREGVLVLSFIANMDQKETIDENISSVLKIANFSAGHQYSDFDPSTDATAGYGLAGMVSGDPTYVAGGLMVAALLLLKKFGPLVLAGLAGLGVWLFRRRKDANVID